MPQSWCGRAPECATSTGELSERVCVIANPAAGRGRGGRILPRVVAAFSAVGVADIRTTTRVRAERQLAQQAISDGCTTIVAVGGDGTCGNVANEILRSGLDVRLGVIPAGTGNDFAHTLGLRPAGLEQVAEDATRYSGTRVDVGRADERFFLNSCGFGYDVAVLRATAGTRLLRGSAVYVVTAMRNLFSYHGEELQVENETGAVKRGRYMLLVIANTRRFGGAFLIAPGASVMDGMLDAVAIRDVPPRNRVPLLLSALRGMHTSRPEVSVSRGTDFRICGTARLHFETDGEVQSATSSCVHVRCIPGALRVMRGRDSAASLWPSA